MENLRVQDVPDAQAKVASPGKRDRGAKRVAELNECGVGCVGDGVRTRDDESRVVRFKVGRVARCRRGLMESAAR